MDKKNTVNVVLALGNLVDELLSARPKEAKVKGLMEQVDIPYTSCSIQQISLVFEKMRVLQDKNNFRKGSHDLPKYT